MALMTQAEYARHRGVSKVAVHKRVKSGRLDAAMVDGKLESDLADQMWLAIRAKPAKKAPAAGQDGGRAPVKAGRGEAKGGQQEASGGPSGGAQRSRQTLELRQIRIARTRYVDVKTERERHQAELARLTLAERTGELVRADEVRKVAFDRSRRARDLLLAIPDRLAPMLAGVTPFEAHRLLDAEIRSVCEAISTDA